MHLFNFRNGPPRSILVQLKSENMKKNMGSADRIIRIVIAVIAAVLYFTGTVTGTVGIILLAVAGIFVLTSLVNFCPIYAALGLKTSKS